MALQIAQLMAAGMVIGTSTTPDRREQLKHFGARLSIWPLWMPATLQFCPASTMKLTTVVALPPMLSVAKRRAPSTWHSPARPVT